MFLSRNNFEVDLEMRLAIFHKQIEYDKSYDKNIHNILKTWLDLAKKYAQELENDIEEVQSIVNYYERTEAGIPEVMPDKLIALRDEAIEEYRAGKALEMLTPKNEELLKMIKESLPNPHYAELKDEPPEKNFSNEKRKLQTSLAICGILS